MKGYEKFAVAVLGVVLTGLNALYGTNPKVQLLIAIATALGVYGVANTPKV
jgi:type IV secretory pathway VirB2 component (pilin)